MAVNPGAQFIGMPIGRIESGTFDNVPVERRGLHNGRPMFYNDAPDRQHMVRIHPLKDSPQENDPKANVGDIAQMKWEPKDSDLVKSEAEHHEEWPTEVGELNHIIVRNTHKRQGIASFMYGYAKKMSESDSTIAPPVHSTHRSDEGDDWAKSTGDPVPPRRFKDY